VFYQPTQRLSQARRNEVARVSKENCGFVASLRITPSSLQKHTRLS
jgi:hypothetical protein